MKTWQGSLGVSEHLGIVSPAYIVCELYGDLDRKYIHHLLRSKPYIGHYNQLSFGVRVSQWDMRYDDFKRIPIFLPPYEEQQAISRFVQAQNHLTRRYIRAKQRLIELLEEQKQALIQRAVTRGLDPDVPLKDSGVRWLERYPETWLGISLKRCVATKITDGPHETPPLQDEGIDFLSAESIVNGHFDFDHRRGFISRELHNQYCQKCRPQRNDIFMCKSGATTGKVAMVEIDRPFSVWSPLALIRPNTDLVLPKFLYFVLQSKYVQRQIQQTWSAGTQPNLSMGDMAQLFIVLPPVTQQQAILTVAEERISKIDDATKQIQYQIDLIREYRTRLIADVVTGKLDVRGVDLPDLDAAVSRAGENEASNLN
jgi:type I restriction enzyme S subunit